MHTYASIPPQYESSSFSVRDDNDNDSAKNLYEMELIVLSFNENGFLLEMLAFVSIISFQASSLLSSLHHTHTHTHIRH